MNGYDDYEIWKNVTKSIKIYSNNKISPKVREDLIVEKKIKRGSDPSPIAKEETDNFNRKNEHQKQINNNNLTVDLTNFDNKKTGIDRNTLKKIRKGNYQIDDILDLHGTKLVVAELRVKSFIKQAFNDQKSFLLIITGKGLHGKGQIRKNISFWLNSFEFSKMILAFSSADKKDGGEGAIYVKLRRNK
ncbi:MAG: hypothetical protein CMP38_02420 [Rickettsiales bacterium]|nr:hypothetical protein [Rickettsiales bacterium]|tara:strand:- start:1303 stop:1869 length:567 start_codon:yes stop_codon:yes gene_type:complete